MYIKELSVITDILWYKIKNHAERLELGAFVVMPNHVHGILILNDDDNQRRDKAYLVSTPSAMTTNNLNVNQTIGQQRFQNQGKNTISSILTGYNAVTKHTHRLGSEFAWQPRFHDYIIRNDVADDRIVKYIQNNPQNWHQDKFHDL